MCRQLSGRAGRPEVSSRCVKARRMEILDTDRLERVRRKLDEIFEALVGEYGMDPNDVCSLMIEAGNTVAEEDGSVYLNVVMREIEERIGGHLF